MGVVTLDDERSFVLADVPGLIPGAASGAGLGDRFLKHLTRTAFLVYFIDVSEASEREPAEDVESLLNEVKAYGEGLEEKPAVVVGNKIDVLEDAAREQNLQAAAARHQLPSFSVSAVSGEGCRALVEELYRRVARLRRIDLGEQASSPVDSG